MAIDFEKGDGLVPAIVQDAVTHRVLMLGYMNAEAYQLTLDREKGFQIAVYSALRMCVDVKAEEVTNRGRMDIAVRVGDTLVYIIELKLDENGKKVLSQIKEKRYYEKYTSEGCRVHLLGINFSSKERNISDWKEEIIHA